MRFLRSSTRGSELKKFIHKLPYELQLKIYKQKRVDIFQKRVQQLEKKLKFRRMVLDIFLGPIRHYSSYFKLSHGVYMWRYSYRPDGRCTRMFSFPDREHRRYGSSYY